MQAPDGRKYTARRVDGGFSPKYDLALLTIESTSKYQLPDLSDRSTISVNSRDIYSTGYPFDFKDLRITSGQISQLSDLPFDDGTQIGYTIDKGKKGIRQGMSGGPIFDAAGHKKFDLAALAIAQAVSQVPNDKPRTNYAYVWNMQSIILRKFGKYDAALKSIEIAIESDRADLMLRHEKAAILRDRENYTAAIAIENELIATKPKWFLYAMRSFSKSKLGDERGALADANMTIKLNPTFEDAYVFRANTKSKLGDTQGAMADIAQALKLNPNNDFAYFHRAMIKANTGDTKGATIDMDRAIELKPDNANNYSQRAVFKSSLGDNRGALEDVERAIKIESFFFAYYKQRGDYKSYLGDEKEAIVDYNKAIELNPKYQPTYISRGQSKSKLGDNTGAILDIERAIELNPKLAYVYYVRAGIKSKTGDKKGSIEDYTKAIELNPKDSDYYISRSNSKLSIGDSKGATDDIDRASELNPKSDSAYLTRAGIKSKTGDRKGAIDDCTKAIELNPKSIVIGRDREALPDLERAIQLNPKQSESYACRGFIKETSGDKQGAIVHLFDSLVTCAGNSAVPKSFGFIGSGKTLTP